MIRNVSWAPNQHIRMISEWSCDTEDWSNDAENSALHHRNKFKYIKTIHSLFSFQIYYLNKFFPLWLVHAFIYSHLPSHVHSQKLVVFGFDFKPSVPCHVEIGFESCGCGEVYQPITHMYYISVFFVLFCKFLHIISSFIIISFYE